MTPNIALLERIAIGDLSPDQAKDVILDLLDSPATGPDEPPECWPEIWYALRSWTWKAIYQRRRDHDDLRDWMTVLDLTHVHATERRIRDADRVLVLIEMVDELISTSTAFSQEEVLQRAHVPDILCLLRLQDDYMLPRADIQAQLGLKTANLSRVLNMMLLTDLLERVPDGKKASFRLTSSGLAAAPPRPLERNTAVRSARRIELHRPFQTLSFTGGPVEPRKAKKVAG